MSASLSVQLTFDLPHKEALGIDDFIVGGSNEKAFEFLTNWPDWNANVAILTGPAGSGKSHLANIWANLSGARQHRAKNLTLDVIPEWMETGTLVVEDVKAGALEEAAFFHLVNAVRGGSGFLLITAEELPTRWGIVTPDLMSRLRAAIPVAIETPDDTLMRLVFVKHFSDRQIVIEPAVIDYLVMRIERSLNAVRDVVARLDEAAFSRGKAITKRLASDVLGF